MSAYVVGKPHIDAMLTAALEWHRTYPTRWYYDGKRAMATLDHTNVDEVGQMLVDENMRSVSFRYHGEAYDTLPGPSDKSALYAYNWTRSHVARDPVAILKALECYEYQTCEHPEWDDSQARAFCVALRHKMIAILPGYEAAAWEITEVARLVR